MDAWIKNDNFIREQLIKNDNVLDTVLENRREKLLPEMEVSSPQGKFLYLLAKIKGAKRILEIGTFMGYSTIWMAKALPHDGQIITLEIDEGYAHTAQENIEMAGFSNNVSILKGSALESLQTLVDAGCQPFDMIFIDADKPNYPMYLELSLKLSTKGTIIYGDNVVRNGRLYALNTPNANIKGVKKFVEDLGAMDCLESTALQTVGAKGYDGFTLSIVR